MSEKFNDGPAFPVYDDNGRYVSGGGLSVRDYFAAKVILGMYCDGSMKDGLDFADEQTSMHKAAAWAYAQADAMLLAREA